MLGIGFLLCLIVYVIVSHIYLSNWFNFRIFWGTWNFHLRILCFWLYQRHLVRRHLHQMEKGKWKSIFPFIVHSTFPILSSLACVSTFAAKFFLFSVIFIIFCCKILNFLSCFSPALLERLGKTFTLNITYKDQNHQNQTYNLKFPGSRTVQEVCKNHSSFECNWFAVPFLTGE